jgi:hypothetical protein
MKTLKIIIAVLTVCIYSSSLAQVDTCDNRITSLTNNDEDSWIMKANDGKYYVAYYSDSSSYADIWISRSTDGGLSWDSTWVAINNTDSAYLPCISQASNGIFHMVWFQIAGPSVEIWYSQSSNAMSWTAPVNLTNNASVDWLPNLVIDYNDNLWVTFASERTGNMDIFIIRSTNAGATWSSPVSLTTHPHHDNLPVLFQALDSSFILTWQRYIGSPYNFLSNTNEIYFKTSPDGITWSTEDSITWDTNSLYTDVFPSIYQNPLDKEIYFTWTTDRFFPQGRSVELSLSAILGGSLGNSATPITCNGYYARVIPADTLGQLILTWVADPDLNGQRDIYSRFLNKNASTVSIQENVESFNYNLFPNPFSSLTTLQTDKFLTNATLTVYDPFGQLVKQIKDISRQTIILHRDNLPSGLYFICLTQDNKVIAADKLIITE